MSPDTAIGAFFFVLRSPNAENSPDVDANNSMGDSRSPNAVIGAFFFILRSPNTENSPDVDVNDSMGVQHPPMQ